MASKSVATLLERERELAELNNVLRETQDDRGQIVLIEAPAGLGKTSLLWATFDTAASMGFASLRTRASELEHDFPYGCMRRLLEPMIAGAAGAERDRLFEDAAALALPLFAAGGGVAAQNAGNGAFARKRSRGARICSRCR